jgi:hypothetical protein
MTPTCGTLSRSFLDSSQSFRRLGQAVHKVKPARRATNRNHENINHPGRRPRGTTLYFPAKDSIVNRDSIQEGIQLYGSTGELNPLYPVNAI